MKHLKIILILLATMMCSACGDSASDFEEKKKEMAIESGEELIAKFEIGIDYAQRVTTILEQVTDDDSAEKAIQQIDALAQERKVFNDVRRVMLSAGTEEQLEKLRDAKQQLDEAVLALDQEKDRIIFSGESNTAIPKTGPMREVTRAIRVAKPERRQ